MPISEVLRIDNTLGLTNNCLMLRISNTRLASLYRESVVMKNTKYFNRKFSLVLAVALLGQLMSFTQIQSSFASPATGNDITAFSFPVGSAGVIDGSAHTVSVAVPYGTDTTTLVATFTLSDSATAAISSTQQVSGTTQNDFSSALTYDVTAEDGTTTQAWVVTVTVASPATGTDITAFSFPVGSAGVIDGSAHTVSVAVPYGTDTTTLVATFTLSDSATAAISSTQQVSGTTQNDFSSALTYDVTAEDGTTTQAWVVTVTVDAYVAPAPAAATVVYIPTTPQTALVLTSSATSVAWGSQIKLTLTGGSGTGAVTYSSIGTTFCAVNPSGNLTPVSAGTCTVTANKDGDGTYGSAQSNSITITATENAVASTSSTSNSGVAMVVGKPVGGVATVKFTVADSYAGEKVSVILATKSSSGKTLYKTLGSAKVGTTGAVSFKTKVKLPVGAVLQLKSAGTVILSKSIK
jgi:hypothetical protein